MVLLSPKPTSQYVTAIQIYMSSQAVCRKMMPRIFFASIKKCIIFSVTRRLEGSGVMNRRSSNNTNKPRSALCFLLYKLATQNGHALSYKVFHFFQFGLKHIFFFCFSDDDVIISSLISFHEKWAFQTGFSLLDTLYFVLSARCQSTTTISRNSH